MTEDAARAEAARRNGANDDVGLWAAQQAGGDWRVVRMVEPGMTRRPPKPQAAQLGRRRAA